MNIEISDGVLRLVGIGMAVAGTYSMVKNAKSSRERALLMTVFIVFWIFFAGELIGMQLLSRVFEDWLSLIYAVGLVISARFVGRRLGQLRLKETKNDI